MAGTNVTFYSYTGDPRVANKTFAAAGAAVALEPFETIGDLSIRMVIDYQDGLLNADYFYAEGKYYRITEREKMTATRMRISGTVDALTTYWSAIAACPCVVERNTTVNNWWIDDGKRPYEVPLINEYIPFQQQITPATQTILITVG